MDGADDVKRPTSDLRNEVLMELASSTVKHQNDTSIEHVQATG